MMSRESDSLLTKHSFIIKHGTQADMVVSGWQPMVLLLELGLLLLLPPPSLPPSLPPSGPFCCASWQSACSSGTQGPPEGKRHRQVSRWNTSERMVLNLEICFYFSKMIKSLLNTIRLLTDPNWEKTSCWSNVYLTIHKIQNNYCWITVSI